MSTSFALFSLGPVDIIGLVAGLAIIAGLIWLLKRGR
jgi:hypothetical protein